MNTVIRSLKGFVPGALRLRLKDAYFSMMLVGDRVRGIEHGLIPPERMNFVGTKNDFLEVGREFLRHFREIGGLKENETVLDIGCGIGRMAIPLTPYLRQGKYFGFDIIPYGVRWCRQRISRQFSNFSFDLADINNSAYNPGGKIAPEKYRFPYSDNTFDFAFATSVFTHLVQASMENYLRELGRVLKPGGRALLTFFVLNEKSRERVVQGKAAYLFLHSVGELYTDNPASPEWAIAVDETWLVNTLDGMGLELVKPIHYGRWCGTENPKSFQDIVLIRKK